ncbi:hypothetical protein PPERSA_09229 [Pseudocohnilembus persalinus]|uniref:Uncharacterized protein n=1 Tax=Pseudocohnilembus persalinus TaxID=266149 RepID=A0A0V0R4D5_PSEPJ|nr:hypothetical protein PPERSA_09229 [Pseudocohnilembus persalinus]|eukprot:KRX09345.1 hypothetical protein PPERSA_09229 [Pseudocohnilembus persalinus]
MFTAQLLLLTYLFSLAFEQLNSSSSKFLNLLVYAIFKEASTWLSGDILLPVSNWPPVKDLEIREKIQFFLEDFWGFEKGMENQEGLNYLEFFVKEKLEAFYEEKKREILVLNQDWRVQGENGRVFLKEN